MNSTSTTPNATGIDEGLDPHVSVAIETYRELCAAPDVGPHEIERGKFALRATDTGELFVVSAAQIARAMGASTLRRAADALVR